MSEMMAALKKEIKTVAAVLLGSLVVLWGIFIINGLLFFGRFNAFGIRPRSITGLIGIFFSPFLHANLPHIINNSISFCLFGTLILLKDIRTFFVVTVISMFTSGIGVWLIGMSNSNHIGASGVILGYFGYCVSVGFIDKKISTLIFSILIILQYGLMIFSVLPGQIGISWEGHLFGFIGGILSALFMKKYGERFFSAKSA